MDVMTDAKEPWKEREPMNEQTYLDLMRQAEGVLYHVASTLLRDEADRRDAMQETALRAWEKRHTLREERCFQTWCVYIMMNVCHSMSRKGRQTVTMERKPERPIRCEEPELRMVLDGLPEKHRLPLVLYYLEGFSVEEIARAMGVPAGTVKYRLHQARKALRIEWNEEKTV